MVKPPPDARQAVHAILSKSEQCFPRHNPGGGADVSLRCAAMGKRVQPAPALEPFLTRRVRELSRLLPRNCQAQGRRSRPSGAGHDAAAQGRGRPGGARPVRTAAQGLHAALRRLRRALGPVRDVDVMLGHLKDLRDDARHGAAVRWLSARLEAQRAELSRSCCNKLSPRGRLAGLRAWETLREELRRGEPADSQARRTYRAGSARGVS